MAGDLAGDDDEGGHQEDDDDLEDDGDDKGDAELELDAANHGK